MVGIEGGVIGEDNLRTAGHLILLTRDSLVFTLE